VQGNDINVTYEIVSYLKPSRCKTMFRLSLSSAIKNDNAMQQMAFLKNISYQYYK